MARPTVTVKITSAPPPRNVATPTGTAIFAFTGGTPANGVANVIRVTNSDQVTTAYGTDAAIVTLAGYVADCLANGAPAVYLTRATSAPADAAAWGVVLAAVTEEQASVAQVAIPGVTTAAARDALVAHVGTFTHRTAFLDAAVNATAADLVTVATAYAAQAGSARVTVAAPWVTMAGPGSSQRDVPASVVMMGRTAAGDAAVGHTNHAPAGDQQGRAAGVIVGGVATKTVFTTAELDSLDDAGVSVIRPVNGRPTIMGWVSVATDAAFHQLNVGRFIGQVSANIRSIGRQFLFTPLDAVTFIKMEGAIRAYLAPLRAARALWTGLDGSKDGYEVAVASVNNADTIAARTLNSSTTISVTPYAHDVTLNLTTSVAQEVPA